MTRYFLVPVGYFSPAHLLHLPGHHPVLVMTAMLPEGLHIGSVVNSPGHLALANLIAASTAGPHLNWLPVQPALFPNPPPIANHTTTSDITGTPNIIKIPRPPNSWILYRQHHHYTVTAAHPDLHNNQICKLLESLFPGHTNSL